MRNVGYRYFLLTYHLCPVMVSGALHNNTFSKIKTNTPSETLKSKFQGCKISVSRADGNAIFTYQSEQNKNTFQQPESPK